MKKNSDLIKHYAVKIECDFGKSGSGVLIKDNDNRCYLATAKHNFTTKGRDDSWRDVKKSFLEKHLSDISISQNKKKICKIINILSFCDGYDVILFEVKDFNEEFKRLSKVNILYEDNYGDEHEYFFHGYPAGKEDGSDDIIQNLTRKNDNNKKYTYDVDSFQKFIKRGLEGFSGSGVFIRDNKRLYLVGIIIHRRDELSSFTAFNLPRFLNEKEPSLASFLLTKNILDLENFKDMQDLIIYRNLDNLLIQEYKNIFQGDTHQASQLPNKANEIGYLGKKFQITNQFIEIEANFRKELADMYLLATIISKKFGEETLVKEYFKKAREYEPRYIRYLKDIDGEYSIDELMRDAKVKFIEENFIEAKIFFKALLYLNINDNQRIYCYEKILEIAKIQNNDKEIIKTSKILLSLYSEEEKLKKAVIYHDLSMMNIEAVEQYKYVNLGLVESQDYIIDENFLEIQYKLKRRKNELIGIKEELLETTDPYLGLRDDLQKLSSIDKSYKSEYKQTVLKETYKDIIKKASKRIRIGIFLAVITITLPLLWFIFMNTLEFKNKIYNNTLNPKYVNDLKIEECNLTRNKNHIIPYDVNSTSKVIALQGFPSAKSDFNQDVTTCLKSILHSNLERIKDIKIYGHTDLEYYGNDKNLGRKRALKVQEIISKEINISAIEAKYNPDFFMRDTDKILNGTLLKALSLNDEINLLMQELNISKEEPIEKIRNDFKSRDLSKYRTRFAPFRSVVILINLKNSPISLNGGETLVSQK